MGGPFGAHFESSRGLGGQEAAGKGSGRVSVGPGVAGDPQMGPTWLQLEPSWNQLGANMSTTSANLELTWAQVGLKLVQVGPNWFK